MKSSVRSIASALALALRCCWPAARRPATDRATIRSSRATARCTRSTSRSTTTSIKPVAQAYVDYVPEPVAPACRNFFGNIDDLFIGDQRPAAGQAGNGRRRFRPRAAQHDLRHRWALIDIASDDGHPQAATRISARPSATGASRRARTCSCRCSGRRPCATAPAALIRVWYSARSATSTTCRCAISLYGLGAIDLRASALDADVADRAGGARPLHVRPRAPTCSAGEYLVYDGKPPPKKRTSESPCTMPSFAHDIRLA